MYKFLSLGQVLLCILFILFIGVLGGCASKDLGLGKPKISCTISGSEGIITRFVDQVGVSGHLSAEDSEVICVKQKEK